MRVLAASVLAFESIVVLLLIPVAITVGNVDPAIAIGIGALVIVVALATAGLLRHSWAYWVGTALQVALVACGFIVSVMFALGLLFAILWGAALAIGQRGDQLRAARYAEAGVDDPKRPTRPRGNAGDIDP